MWISPLRSLTTLKESFTFFLLFILFFWAVLGLCFCVRAFSSCGTRGPLFIAVHGPLTVAASLVAEHRLQSRRLSSCGSRAQLLHGMWDLPRPGLEPVSPALAGRLSTTAPPGKPLFYFFNLLFSLHSKDAPPLPSILDNAFWHLWPCVVSSYVERGLAL